MILKNYILCLIISASLNKIVCKANIKIEAIEKLLKYEEKQSS
jgi:hypothetical protein